MHADWNDVAKDSHGREMIQLVSSVDRIRATVRDAVLELDPMTALAFCAAVISIDQTWEETPPKDVRIIVKRLAMIGLAQVLEDIERFIRPDEVNPITK